MNIYHNACYPRRGEIYYIKQGDAAPTGSEMWSDRHAIIVSSDNINKHSNVVQVVYITTRDKVDAPTHVDISTQNLRRIALCEQVTPIDKTRLVEYKGRLTDKQMKQIDKAIAWTLNLCPYMEINNIDKGIPNVV